MDIKEIKELLKAFDESSSSYFLLNQDGVELKFKKPENSQQVVMQATTMAPVAAMQASETALPQEASQVTAAPVAQPESQPDGELVKAPLVGVFYSAPSPDDQPYVQVGDKVEEGQILCLIEAMKMMSEITAPRAGIIKEIYAKNQDVVGFEEKLFLIGD